MNEPCKQAVELQGYFGLSASTAYTAILKAMKSYAAEQNTDLLRENAELRAEEAYLKLQRNSLLEMTWLDLPDEPEESIKRWKEEFEKGWVRRDELNHLKERIAALDGALRASVSRDVFETGMQGLQRQNADLRTELETIRKAAEIYKSMADKENAELRRQVVELTKDKERLDWLARHHTINQGLFPNMTKERWDDPPYRFKSSIMWQGHKIRAAIDAARKDRP